MLIGCLNTYNDFPLVKATYESISLLVDLVVVVDGRYEDFEQVNGSDISTDGTLEYLERRNDTKIIIWPNVSEVHKRNCYLIGQYPTDWYLQLDGDEEWSGPLAIPKADMGIVPVVRSDFAGRTYNPLVTDRIRVFRHVDGLRYARKHYWLFDGEERTFATLQKPGRCYTAERLDAKIIHHEDKRDAYRNAAKAHYYRNVLTPRESKIKEVD